MKILQIFNILILVPKVNLPLKSLCEIGENSDYKMMVVEGSSHHILLEVEQPYLFSFNVETRVCCEPYCISYLDLSSFLLKDGIQSVVQNSHESKVIITTQDTTTFA